MTPSYWHGKPLPPVSSGKPLPPVSSILSLSADHFNSEMFHGQSFLCNESLQSSPSTSMGFHIEPPRARQPLQQANSGPLTYPSSSSFSMTFVHHHHHHQVMKQSNSSPALISVARKRRSIQLKLERHPKAFVFANLDPVIHHEDKPLQRLLQNELDYLPSLKSIRKLQNEITTEFREKAVIWLEEVCFEANCDVVIFPLAISFMDRFLSKQSVPKMHLQGLASACLLLAGKIKAPYPLSSSKIVYYTDGAVTLEQLLDWELAVTATLEWQLYSPTAFEFYDQLFTRSPALTSLRKAFQKAAYRLLQDETLACQKPSQQAAYALGYAAAETGDAKLTQAARNSSSKLFGVSSTKFRNGVSAVAKLFKNETGDQVLATLGSMLPLQSSSIEHLAVVDEGSPRKMKKTNSPKRYKQSPEPMVISPMVTTCKMARSHSTAENHYTSPLQAQDLRKTMSVTSLSRTSFSDDSGFHSEVSSPDISLTTTASPTTTMAGKKSRKSRSQSSRLLTCFYK